MRNCSIKLLTIIAAGVLTLASCSRKEAGNHEASGTDSVSAPFAESKMAAPAEPDSSPDSGIGRFPKPASAEVLEGLKIKKSGSYSAETENILKVSTKIDSVVKAQHGYIVNSDLGQTEQREVSGQKNDTLYQRMQYRPHIIINIAVPASQFPELISSLDHLPWRINSRQISQESKTMALNEQEARKNLSAKQGREASDLSSKAAKTTDRLTGFQQKVALENGSLNSYLSELKLNEETTWAEIQVEALGPFVENIKSRADIDRFTKGLNDDHNTIPYGFWLLLTGIIAGFAGTWLILRRKLLLA